MKQGDDGKKVTKKNKIPFSFLMHHYMKTNGGSKEQLNNEVVSLKI